MGTDGPTGKAVVPNCRRLWRACVLALFSPSIAAAGTVADGMVFVNSGYSRFGEAPGNVLLAFSTQSK